MLGGDFLKRNLFIWQFAGFSFASLLGVLLHFLYDITGENLLAAPFSGVNESTWEHMKLLFWPLFLFALIQWRFADDFKGFWCVKLKGILSGLVFIPLVFYTLNGVFGKTPDWLNISIFFLAVAVAFLVELKTFGGKNARCKYSKTAFYVICFIGLLFIVFTFATPKIPLFLDPLTGTYGI